MNIIAISGSPRPNGNTNYLVDEALNAAAKDGASINKFVLSEMNIKPCLAHDKCYSFKRCARNDDICKMFDKYLEADGVILATPVYYFNMTAQMKIFIDRNYFVSVKSMHPKAKTVGLIVVAESEGIEDTLQTLTKFVNWTFRVSPVNCFTVTGYATNAGDIKKKPDVIEKAREMGRKMAEIGR